MEEWKLNTRQASVREREWERERELERKQNQLYFFTTCLPVALIKRRAVPHDLATYPCQSEYCSRHTHHLHDRNPTPSLQ